jgi:hypothetical protein
MPRPISRRQDDTAAVLVAVAILPRVVHVYVAVLYSQVTQKWLGVHPHGGQRDPHRWRGVVRSVADGRGLAVHFLPAHREFCYAP